MLTPHRKARPSGMLRSVRFLTLLTWLLAGATTSLLHGQQQPSPEDITALVQISNLQMNRTGETVMYVLTLPSKSDFVTELWKVQLSGGQPVRLLTKPGIDALEWSPDSAWIAFIRATACGSLRRLVAGLPPRRQAR